MNKLAGSFLLILLTSISVTVQNMFQKFLGQGTINVLSLSPDSKRVAFISFTY